MVFEHYCSVELGPEESVNKGKFENHVIESVCEEGDFDAIICLLYMNFKMNRLGINEIPAGQIPNAIVMCVRNGSTIMNRRIVV